MRKSVKAQMVRQGRSEADQAQLEGAVKEVGAFLREFEHPVLNVIRRANGARPQKLVSLKLMTEHVQALFKFTKKAISSPSVAEHTEKSPESYEQRLKESLSALVDLIVRAGRDSRVVNHYGKAVVDATALLVEKQSPKPREPRTQFEKGCPACGFLNPAHIESLKPVPVTIENHQQWEEHERRNEAPKRDARRAKYGKEADGRVHVRGEFHEEPPKSDLFRNVMKTTLIPPWGPPEIGGKDLRALNIDDVHKLKEGESLSVGGVTVKALGDGVYTASIDEEEKLDAKDLLLKAEEPSAGYAEVLAGADILERLKKYRALISSAPLSGGKWSEPQVVVLGDDLRRAIDAIELDRAALHSKARLSEHARMLALCLGDAIATFTPNEETTSRAALTTFVAEFPELKPPTGEKRKRDPRNNAQDAFEAFMGLGQDAWDDVLKSLWSGGTFTPAEEEGFRRACTERTKGSKR